MINNEISYSHKLHTFLFLKDTYKWNLCSIQKCLLHFRHNISWRFPFLHSFSEHLNIWSSFLRLTSFGFGANSQSPEWQWSLKCSRQNTLPHLHWSGKKSVWLQAPNWQCSPRVGNSMDLVYRRPCYRYIFY